MSIEQFPRPRTVQPFTTFSPEKWVGRQPPPYDWIVEGCLLRGTVGMLSGDGGLGKSLLMQQLCTAAAIGHPWLGLETKRCKTFAFFCEDDEDELERRQYWINRHYGVDGPDLGDIEYAPRVGMENVLMEFDRKTDRPQPTPLFAQLSNRVRELGAQIVILDTLADVFAGNEIIRNQVRRFITALRKLALEIQGVIVLTAHPSLTGMNSGTGLSGSTGWNNSVRSRMYLTKQRTENEDEEDNNERLLKTMKNNQGPFGGKLKLRWHEGVFIRADAGSERRGTVAQLEMESALMAALRTMITNGARLAADPNASGSFVNRSKQMCKFPWRDVLAVQERWLANGKLVRVEMGPPSRRYVFVRPPDMIYPGEETQ